MNPCAGRLNNHRPRTPGPTPSLDQRPARVQRTVPCRGGTQIIANAPKSDCLRRTDRDHRGRRDHPWVYDHRDHLIKNVPRASRKEVRRPKAYGHTTNHTTT